MHDLTGKYKVNFSFNFLMGSLLLLLIAFPYLQLIQLASYTQPYALIFGAVIFPLVARSVLFRLNRTDQVALVGIALTGIIIFLMTCYPYKNPQEYKYLISFVSPLLLTLPILFYLRKYGATAVALLRFAIYIWLITALGQKLFNPNFLVFLIGQWGEHALDIIESGRGVLGLAPEPTHHAFHILLLAACLALIDTQKRSRWLIILCVIDAVVLAASASAILVVGVAAVIWSIFYRQRWILLLLILFVIVFDAKFTDEIFIDNNSRVAQLISVVTTEPMSFLTLDYSMNMRLAGMAAIFYTTLNNLLVPFGMSLEAWEIARENLLNDLTWLIDLSSVGPPSGIGQLFFQAGLFGAIFLGIIFRRILNSRVGELEKIILIATPLIFLSQYYISAPTFSFLYACALYRLENQRTFK
jgi:hypothetical protein